MYNHENEKAMARAIHGANHGESLSKTAGYVQTAVAREMPSPTMNVNISSGGWSTGLDQKPAQHNIYNNKISQAEPARTQDSELLIRKLDTLVDQIQSLCIHANQRLERFTAEAKPAENGDNLAKKVYDCESSYFRILESRTDTIKYYVDTLNRLIGGVSAPLEIPLVGVQGTAAY